MRIRDKAQIPTTTKPPKPDISDNESIAGLNVQQRKSVKMELLAATALKAAEEAVEAANALAVARASLQMKKQTYCQEGYIEKYMRSRGQPMPEDCSVMSTNSFEERDAVEEGASLRKDDASISREEQSCKDDIIYESLEEREGAATTDCQLQTPVSERQESTILKELDEELTGTNKSTDEREAVSSPADSDLKSVEEESALSEEKTELMDTNEKIDEKEVMVSSNCNLLTVREEVSETPEELKKEIKDIDESVDERESVASQSDSNLQSTGKKEKELSEEIEEEIIDPSESSDGKKAVTSPADSNLQREGENEENTTSENLDTELPTCPIDTAECAQIFDSKSDEVAPFDEISSENDHTTKSELHQRNDVREEITNAVSGVNNNNDNESHAPTNEVKELLSNTAICQSSDSEGDGAHKVHEEKENISSATQEMDHEAVVDEEDTFSKEPSITQETITTCASVELSYNITTENTVVQLQEANDEINNGSNGNDNAEEDVQGPTETTVSDEGTEKVIATAGEKNGNENNRTAPERGDILYAPAKVKDDDGEVAVKLEEENINSTENVAGNDDLIEQTDMIIACDGLENDVEIEDVIAAVDNSDEMAIANSKLAETSEIVENVSGTAESRSLLPEDNEKQAPDQEEQIVIAHNEVSEAENHKPIILSEEEEQTSDKMKDVDADSEETPRNEIKNVSIPNEDEDQGLEQVNDASNALAEDTAKELAEQISEEKSSTEEKTAEPTSSEPIADEAIKHDDEADKQLEEVLTLLNDRPEEGIVNPNLLHQEDEVVECPHQIVEEGIIHKNENLDDEPTECTVEEKDKSLVENTREENLATETNVSTIDNEKVTITVNELAAEENKLDVGECIAEKESFSVPIEEGFVEIIPTDESDASMELESTNVENVEATQENAGTTAATEKNEAEISDTALDEEDTMAMDGTKQEEDVQSSTKCTVVAKKQEEELDATIDSVTVESVVMENNAEEQTKSAENEGTPLEDEFGSDHDSFDETHRVDCHKVKEMSSDKEGSHVEQNDVEPKSTEGSSSSDKCNEKQREETFSAIDVHKFIESMKDRCNNIENEIRSKEDYLEEPTESLPKIINDDRACSEVGNGECKELEAKQCAGEENIADTIVSNDFSDETNKETQALDEVDQDANIEEELNSCLVEEKIEDLTILNNSSQEAKNEYQTSSEVNSCENEKEELNQSVVEEKVEMITVVDNLSNETSAENRVPEIPEDTLNTKEEHNQYMVEEKVEETTAVDALSNETSTEDQVSDKPEDTLNKKEETNQCMVEEEMEETTAVDVISNETSTEERVSSEPDDTENNKEERNHPMVEETIITNAASKELSREEDGCASSDDDSQEARDKFEVTTSTTLLFEEPTLTAKNYKPCDEEVQDFIQQITHNFSDVNPTSPRKQTLSAERECIEGDEEVQEFIKEITNNFTDVNPISPRQQTLTPGREKSDSDEEVQDFIKNLVDEYDDEDAMQNDLKEETDRKILLQSSIENDIMNGINNIGEEKLQDEDNPVDGKETAKSPLLQRFKMEHDLLNYKDELNHTDNNEDENISDMKESVVNENAGEEQCSDADIVEEDKTKVFEAMQKNKYQIQHEVVLAGSEHNACGSGCLVS